MLLAILLFPFIRYGVTWIERQYDVYQCRQGPRKEKEYSLFLRCRDDDDNPFRRLERKRNKQKIWRNLSVISLAILFSIHVVLPQLNQQQPPEIPPQTIPEPPQLGINMSHCLSSERHQYCYYERQWAGPITRLEEPTPHYFIDQYEDVYFTKWGTKRDSDGNVVLGGNMIKETHLVRTLTRLREKEGERCICPAFLGIMDNMSFIYYHDTKEWIIMNEPLLGEPTTGARLVNTRVKYPDNSAFKQFLPPLAANNEHYDSFSVSFNSPSFQFDSNDVRPLATFNHKLLHYDTVEMKRDEQTQFILRRLDRESEMRRISIKLKGDEAICFIFCQRLHQQ